MNGKDEINNILRRKPIKIPSADDIINELDIYGKIKPSSRVRFSRHSGVEEREKFARTIIKETNPDKKAEMLHIFALGDNPFPLSHETIIEYSKSEHERLREESLYVLTKCRSECVRKYSLQLLTENKYKAHAIEMLILNYTPADKTQL